MLIDYLHKHFLTTTAFAAAAGWTPVQLSQAIAARVMPGPSYRLAGMARVTSFVADEDVPLDASFHLAAHLAWAAELDRLQLQTEPAARAHFMQRYDAAKRAFAESDRGQPLLRTNPEVMARFDPGHAAATWDHFLNGVYGVCTRDGAPETVFHKQVGVMIVETLSRTPPDRITPEALTRLAEAVDFLDEVASDFAPHERARSSRQRCITDIRTRFLKGA